VLAGSGQQCGPLLAGERAGGAPEDVSLAINEQGDDLLVVGNGQIAKKRLAIDEEGDDPVPGGVVGLIAAHGGGFPPAKDKILTAGDGELIAPELRIEVLRGLGGRNPRVRVLLLLGRKGNDQEIGLALEAAGEGDLLPIETVSRNRGKNSGLFGLRRLGSREREGRKQRSEPWFSYPQGGIPER